MPQYSFAIADGRSPTEESFFELVDLAEAKAQAIRTAGEVLSDIGLGSVWDGVPWKLVVRDESRVEIIEISFVIKCDLGKS